MRFTLRENATAYEVESPDNSPGSGEAGDGADILDAFMVDLMIAVEDLYELDDEDAIDAVLSVVGDMIDNGTIADMPEEGADSDEEAAWVLSAHNAGLAERVLEMLDMEDAEEDDEETEDDADEEDDT